MFMIQTSMDKIAKLPNSQSINVRLFLFIKKKKPKSRVSRKVNRRSCEEVLNSKGNAYKGAIKNPTATPVIIALTITRMLKSVREIAKNSVVGFTGVKAGLKINFFPANNN